MKQQRQNVIFGMALGRMPAEDDRDKNFPMRAVVAPIEVATARRYKRYWNAEQWWGNQGASPHCVAYSAIHYLEDGPITHKRTAAPLIEPARLYKMAQERDEWEGTDYDGTSARGVMKAMVELGLIKEYRWGKTVEDMVAAVLSDGPVLFGTNWYRKMFTPLVTDIRRGYSKQIISIGGPLDGGHEVLINGVNTQQELFRIKNSWGRGWGDNGHCWITFETVRRLLAEDADICLPIENENPPLL